MTFYIKADNSLTIEREIIELLAGLKALGSEPTDSATLRTHNWFQIDVEVTPLVR